MNVQQLTIQFHADNLKLLYVDQSILAKTVKGLNRVFRTGKKESAETKVRANMGVYCSQHLL